MGAPKIDDDVACWSVNEDGHWCPSCGDLVARPEWLEDGAHLPDECRQCGYPDAGAVAEYHCGPDDDDCWNCGGEGFVYNCFEEYACIDPEGGCDLCMGRCDVCRPRGKGGAK